MRRRKDVRRSERLSPDWQRRRLAVLEAASYRCEVGGPRCTATASEVDHIKPLASGGSNHFHNLRAICSNCHTDRSVRNTSRDWV